MNAPEIYRAEIGYTFPAESICIDAKEQQRLHYWCGIDIELYDQHVDPTFVSRRPILLNTATAHASRPGWVPVHTIHRILQRRPITLGENLHMVGSIQTITPHSRGEVMTSVWHYLDAQQKIAFVVSPEVLMVAPKPPRIEGAVTNPSKSAQFDFKPWGTKQCTPESTRGYCEGSKNLVHLDEAYARSFGFRAPIIAGMQTVNFLLEPLYHDRRRSELEVEIQFLRPVFWDDLLYIEVARDPADEEVVALRARNEAGKCVAVCEMMG